MDSLLRLLRGPLRTRCKMKLFNAVILSEAKDLIVPSSAR